MVSDPQAAAKRILEHDAKATPGLWVVHGDGDGAEWVVQEEGPLIAEGDFPPDVRFIADVRSDAPVVARAYHEAIEALQLALNGIPDPMHPGIPPKFVDKLVAAQIVVMDALGHDDPGNVEAATERLAAVSVTPTKENA